MSRYPKQLIRLLAEVDLAKIHEMDGTEDKFLIFASQQLIPCARRTGDVAMYDVSISHHVLQSTTDASMTPTITIRVITTNKTMSMLSFLCPHRQWRRN